MIKVFTMTDDNTDTTYKERPTEVAFRDSKGKILALLPVDDFFWAAIQHTAQEMASSTYVRASPKYSPKIKRRQFGKPWTWSRNQRRKVKYCNTEMGRALMECIVRANPELFKTESMT